MRKLKNNSLTVDKLNIKELNEVIKSRKIKGFQSLNKEAKKEIVETILLDKEDKKKKAKTTKVKQAENELINKIVNKYKNIRAVENGIILDSKSNKSKEVLIKEYNSFSKYRVTNKNIADKEGLYEAIDKYNIDNGNVQNFTLFAKSKLSNKIRYINLKQKVLRSKEKFLQYLEDLEKGNIPGSDSFNDAQDTLILNVFDALLENRQIGKSKKYLNKTIYKTENIEIKNNGLCGYESLKKMAENMKQEFDLTVEEYKSKNIKEIHNFTLECFSFGIKEILSSCISIEYFNVPVEFRSREKEIKIIEYGKEKDIECLPLRDKDIKKHFYNLEHFKRGTNECWEDRKRVLRYRKREGRYPDLHDEDGMQIPMEAIIKENMYCLNEEELKELKKEYEEFFDYKENGDVKEKTFNKYSEYLFENFNNIYIEEQKPDKYILFDHKAEHYTISSGEIDDILISTERKLYKKIGDKYEELTSFHRAQKEAADLEFEYRIKIKRYYIFFDYEVVFDFERDNVNVPYSLSILVLDQDELANLNIYDQQDKKENISEIIKDHGKVFMGYDCTNQFYEYFKTISLADRIYTFVSYNGVNFDNYILYSELSEIEGDCLGKPFFQGSGLFNFKINGVHDMFDLKKHLTYSLKKVCEAFKVKSCSKKEFDHIEAQNEYTAGRFKSYLNKNREGIEEYNIYDVLSLAVLYRKYESVLKGIDDSIKLEDTKTIGSFIMKKLNKYWYEKKYKLFCFTDKKKKIQEKYARFYEDLLTSRVGGRVELFNGIKKIEEIMASPDVCSLYPYVMIVKDCYYPVGDPTETEKYVKGKIGFYYCDVDQSYLQKKDLVNIIPKKTKEGNDWGTKEILKNILISSVKIELLKKHGGEKCIKVKNGYYFEGKAKSCEFFKPLLELMKMKNEQDKYKEENNPEYNGVLREVIKMLLNCPSGKLNEGLHADKIDEMNICQYTNLKNNKDVKNIMVLSDSRNGRILVSYKLKTNKSIKNANSIHIGSLIYDYSQEHMYEHMYSKMKRPELVYTDTDSNKVKLSVFNRWVEEYGKKIQVPHWKEIEEHDSRYKNHNLYESGSKVFGSFEDEYKGKGMDLHYFICKKQYLSINKMDNSKNKYTFKGIKDNDVILPDNFDTNKDQSELHKIYTESEKIKDNMIGMFDKMYENNKTGNTMKVLTFSIRRERKDNICVKSLYLIKELKT